MNSKTPIRLKRGCPAMAVVAISLSLASLHAATIDKADNIDNLSEGVSWAGGSPPAAQDLARWGSGVSSANSAALGADVSWGGIIVADPAGAVAIVAGNALTLGRSGIDMSAATQDLSISSGLALLANTNQVWNVGTGRSLNLNTGAFVRGANATLNVQGAGVVTTTMTGLALTNNILGAWATYGTGTATSYATINASNAIVGLTYGDGTGGTGIGVANAGLIVSGAGSNYSVADGGTFNGVLNTLRYTGGESAISTTSNTTSFNGVTNAGSGTLTLNGTGRILVGSQTLVFNTATGNISVGVTRVLGTNAIVKAGSHELSLGTAYDGNWSGGLYVNEGTVTALHSTTAANGSQLGAGGGVHVASGATVNLDAYSGTRSDLTYKFGALTGEGAVNVNTGFVGDITKFNGSFAGFTGVLNVGYKSTGGKMVLEAATVGVGATARIHVADKSILHLEGGITVAADLTLAGGNTDESFGQLRLEGDSVYSGDITLTGDVVSTDYTIGSNVGIGGTISGDIGESGGSRSLSKGGEGTVILTGTNTYTGTTLVAVGNLQVGKSGVGSTHASSLVSVNGTTAILSGTGTLNGAATLLKGKIRPGDAGGQNHGTLNFGNGLTLNPTGVATVAELSVGGTSVADQTGDRIHITGDFTLDGESNILVTADAGFIPTQGQQWTLIDWTGVLALNGWNIGSLQRDGSADDGSNFDLPDIAASGLYWEITALQDGATGGAIVISIAPEPSRVLLLALSGLLFALRRRRKA